MHEGHRSRLVGKIKKSSELYEHELLEVLLFRACPRKNVNGTAHELINRFGSIKGVFQASAEELVTVNGVGENIAQYLVLLAQCLKMCNDSKSFGTVRSTAEFKEMLEVRAFWSEGGVKEFFCLDKDGRVRRICTFKGKRGAPPKVEDYDVLKMNIVCKPYGIFAAYYRDSDDCRPEKEDDEWFYRLDELCRLGGVRLHDYCIVGRNNEIYSYFVADRFTRGAEDNGRD